MAEFCKECGERLFGPGYNDAKDITTKEEWKRGYSALFTCEDCGVIQVDPEGRCISPDCYHMGMPGHGCVPDSEYNSSK